MRKPKTYSVQELATLSGVTPRTLHYYDKITLLVPERRANGYRIYNQDHLLRLQQILLHREMGLSLEEIRNILDATDFDYHATLKTQRKQLLQRATIIDDMIKAIDTALNALSHNKHANKETDMSLFNGFTHKDHQAEAEEKWGQTSQYQEGARRMSKYGPEEIADLKREEANWVERITACFKNQHAANSGEALALAEEHRLYIERWFYPCPYIMHKNLGTLYVSDEKFSAYYDEKIEGLAQFLHDAIHANASRHSAP